MATGALSAEVIVALTFGVPSLFLSILSVWFAYTKAQETRHRTTRNFEIEDGAPSPINFHLPRLVSPRLLDTDTPPAIQRHEHPLITDVRRSSRRGMRRAVNVATRYQEVELETLDRQTTS
ncbi:hypothetical protein V8F33_007047 [Rhypophila sp. PSN 637]